MNRLVIMILLIGCFFCTLLALTKVVVRLSPEPQLIAISGYAVPPEFPVLVVSRDHAGGVVRATIVFMHDPQPISARWPGCSFLVPMEAEASLHSQVSRQSFSRALRVSGPGSFTVKQLSQSMQCIQVTGTWGSRTDPHIFRGFYTATDHSIVPKRFSHSYHTGRMIQALPISLVLSLLGWAVCMHLWERHRVARANMRERN